MFLVNKNNNTEQAVTSPHRVQLVLPGGGAYGEYTKSVLVEFLSRPEVINGDVVISGVTGTSAGAINGALLVSALNEGGPELAIKRLNSFWDDIRKANPFASSANIGNLFAFNREDSFPNLPRAWCIANEIMSPEHLFPGTTLRSLKSLLKKHIPDVKSLHQGPADLVVNALRARDNEEVIFSGKTLNHDTLIASCALADLKGHIIDGELYYDGGYSSNPHMETLKKGEFDSLLAICPVPDSGRAFDEENFSLFGTFNRHSFKVDRSILKVLDELEQSTDTDFSIHRIELRGEKHWNRSTLFRTDSKWLDFLRGHGKKDWAKFCNDNQSYAPHGKKFPFSQNIA
ncbi:MAG: hypothetical protein CMH28_01095 [Micavibrio sp.]|nr:hypothetical protein [Micavibrio sp.]